MRTNRLITLFSCTAIALAIAGGCSGGGDATAASTEVKLPSSTTMSEGDNVKQTGGKIVSDPADVKKGGSYKLAPPNPDDPHFKPDPKLGGGG